MRKIENATLIEAGLNDGDSFKVKAGGEELHLRLYYVDCPETTYSSKTDWERATTQQHYFGLEDLDTVVQFGRQAAAYVKRVLARPFTVHTSRAVAPSRSATVRYYAFIETHDGHDLGHLLVEQGLARIHGVGRAAPDGTPKKDCEGRTPGSPRYRYLETHWNMAVNQTRLPTQRAQTSAGRRAKIFGGPEKTNLL